MGGKGALNYLPIVHKASIYVPKVMCKTVMGGNTVSETYTHIFPFQSARSFDNWPRQSIQSVRAEYGGKDALNYLPIVPKASIYVPKVMHKPVMGGNAVFETFTHMFLFRSASNVEKWPRQPNRSVMAEYGREWCVELSSHCAQSLHICPKGNVQTGYGW
jgi:hypothetical protein